MQTTETRARTRARRRTLLASRRSDLRPSRRSSQRLRNTRKRNRWPKRLFLQLKPARIAKKIRFKRIMETMTKTKNMMTNLTLHRHKKLERKQPILKNENKRIKYEFYI